MLTLYSSGWVFSMLSSPFVLISWSEQYISSGLASILNSSQPLFTIILAPLFVSEERITLPRILGLILGFSGVIVLMSNRTAGQRNPVITSFANFTMLLAAISYAGGAIFAKAEKQMA